MFAIALLITAAPIVLAQPARNIARIEIEGLQNLTRENVVEMTGLKTGEAFSLGAIDAAAQRLIDSGLFKNVGYRTRTVGTAVTITFQVEERKSNKTPVVFDNFIWFSDAELIEVVKGVLPSFDGRIPDTGKSAEMIKEALQGLLTARKIAGTIEHTLTETGHLFRVAGVPLNICTLHFPGAKAVSEQKLAETTKSSTDLAYSRQAVATFPRYGLYPLYRELGYLKASFEAPIAKPDTNPGCEGGVDLTIPVNEGLVYSWSKPEWSGNKVIWADELDAVLGMKVGEVANGKKLDRGIHQVERAYGKHGHIDARMDPVPEFDDSTQRVTFKITVSEGPQYRMGSVEFTGVSDGDAATLKEKWALTSGQIYDQTYTDKFFREDAAQLLGRLFEARGLMQRTSAPVDIKYNVNRQALIVNIVIEVTR